ncbi:MAG: Clp protease N-terminal domain-containing protein [Microthrixaceae bacterium]|nr:Clp protease N-terminal domain-containing protein [Microthrixaceae bacterium]
MTAPAPPDRADVVAFLPYDLLHKFGFSDGDLLFGVIGRHHLDVDHHDLLVAVVERLVVPQLDQEVETSTWPRPTLHNPIRAVTVDGEDASLDSTITPDVVEVPVVDIVRIARTLPSRRDSTSDEVGEDDEVADGAVDEPIDGPAADRTAELPLSFGAAQLTGVARQVRRAHGGAELHVEHWLAAVLRDDGVAERVLCAVDRSSLADALERQLDQGELDAPLDVDEAHAHAAGVARRSGHGVVTTRDLAEAVVTVAEDEGLVRRLAPPERGPDRDRPPSAGPPARTGRSGPPSRSVVSALEPTPSSGGGWYLLVGVVVAIAVALPLGWVLSRQRSSSAEDAVRDRVEVFTEALAAGDGDSACAMLGDTAADDLAAQVRRDLGGQVSRPCPAAVQVAASERTAGQDAALADLEPGDVAYVEEWTPGIRDQPDTFEQATATVAIADGEVSLRSDDVRTDRAASWTITDAGPLVDLLAPA